VPLTVIGLVWVALALTVTAWPRDMTNPVLGPTRVIWEIGGGLIILAGIAWIARPRTRPRKAAGEHAAECQPENNHARPATCSGYRQLP
jgi:hypothetical protein